MPNHPLEQLRRELNLTQEQLAKKLRSQQSVISLVLRRLTDPSPALARRIVKAFPGRITFNDIYGVSPRT